GARLLASRLASPLTDSGAIATRLDAVQWLLEDSVRRAKLRAALHAAPALSRSLARLSLGRGGPRDLAAVCGALDAAQAMAAVLRDPALPSELADCTRALAGVDAELRRNLADALTEDLPLSKADG